MNQKVEMNIASAHNVDINSASMNDDVYDEIDRLSELIKEDDAIRGLFLLIVKFFLLIERNF